MNSKEFGDKYIFSKNDEPENFYAEGNPLTVERLGEHLEDVKRMVEHETSVSHPEHFTKAYTPADSVLNYLDLYRQEVDSEIGKLRGNRSLEDSYGKLTRLKQLRAELSKLSFQRALNTGLFHDGSELSKQYDKHAEKRGGMLGDHVLWNGNRDHHEAENATRLVSQHYSKHGLELIEKDPELFKKWAANRANSRHGSLFQIIHNAAGPLDDYKRNEGEAGQHLAKGLEFADEALTQSGKKLNNDMQSELLMLLGNNTLTPELRNKAENLLSKHGVEDADDKDDFVRVIRAFSNKDPNVSTDQLIQENSLFDKNYADDKRTTSAIINTLINNRPDAIDAMVRNMHHIGTSPMLDYAHGATNYEERDALSKQIVNSFLKLSNQERKNALYHGTLKYPSKILHELIENMDYNGETKKEVVSNILKDGADPQRMPIYTPSELGAHLLHNGGSDEDFENFLPYLRNLRAQAIEHFRKSPDMDNSSWDMARSAFGRKTERMLDGFEDRNFYQDTGIKRSDEDKRQFFDGTKLFLNRAHDTLANQTEEDMRSGKNSFLEDAAGDGQFGSHFATSLVHRAIMDGNAKLLERSMDSLPYDVDELPSYFHPQSTESAFDAFKDPELRNSIRSLFKGVESGQIPVRNKFSMRKALIHLASKAAGASDGYFPKHKGNAASIDSDFLMDGYKDLAVKLGSSGLRALRHLAEQAMGRFSISKAPAKQNPFRKTVVNEKTVDDWEPFLQEGELSLSKLKDYRDYVSTRPEGRSAVPKIDRILDHVMSTGNFKVDDLPPQLKSSPVKKKVQTSQTTVDWDKISTGGNLDPNKLTREIDSIPDKPISFFTGKYTLGAQQHSRLEQRLLGLAAHPTQMKQIKDEGLGDTYKLMQDLLPTSNHPQDENGIGWVRWSSHQGPDGKWNHHIDEVQSDIDKYAIERLQKRHSADDGTPTDYLKELMPKMMRVREILFHGQEPGDILHEAWQQHMRDQGKVGEVYGIWSHKSVKKKKISGFERPEEPAPVRWMKNYGTKLEEMGAQPSQYGSISSQDSHHLQGEPTYEGHIYKTEEVLAKAGSLANLFHTANDNAVEQAFHVNPNKGDVNETIDELLSTPEGKSSLAAYLQRSADTHHGQTVMKQLTDHSGPYWLRTLAIPYERLTGENFLKHAGRHFLPTVASEEGRGADEVLEHLLAHTPEEHRDDMLAPLRGTPEIKNPSVVGTLANTLYRDDPAQLFHDYNVSPDIVQSLPKSAQLGFLVYSMEKHGHHDIYGSKPSMAKDVAKSVLTSEDDAKELTDYARVRGIDPHGNKLFSAIMNDNPRIKPFTDTQLSVKVGSAALRKLRDYLQANGDKLPNELPSGERWNTITKPISGRNGTVQHVLDWNPLRNKSGKLSAETVQAHIDSMDPVTYDFDIDDYHDPKPQYDLEQVKAMVGEDTFKRMFNTKHSDVPQKVLRLKLSDHDMGKLRSTGADRTLATLVDIGRQSGHPVTPNTVGWIRFTQGKDGGVMIDEAQSDLETNFEKALRGQFENMYQGASKEQIDHAINQFMAKLPAAHIEQIKQVAFRGRPATEVLNEALHQYGRHKGWTGSKWHAHSSKSKAPIALDMSKPMPAHFKENYDEGNRALGATPATYGELETQSQPKHPHLNGAPTWAEEIRKKEEG